jgi:hypothetical protein
MLEKGLVLHFSHLEIEEIFHIPSAKNIFLPARLIIKATERPA